MAASLARNRHLIPWDQTLAEAVEFDIPGQSFKVMFQ
jgi:hypothetical protein